jgi:hypothetical protein
MKRISETKRLLGVLHCFDLLPAEQTHLLPSICLGLVRAATALHRLDVISSSYRELTPTELQAEECHLATVRAHCQKLGLKWTTGDPRGAGIQLYLPDRRSNNFGGETWGIGFPEGNGRTLRLNL